MDQILSHKKQTDTLCMMPFLEVLYFQKLKCICFYLILILQNVYNFFIQFKDPSLKILENIG